MSLGFYRAFEEKWRGSREIIKLRLSVYLPLIEQLISFYGDAKAIDLGCGRGEWLELLKVAGCEAHGVDLDKEMIASCRELNLNVHQEEAVSYLKKLPDASYVVVSCFHIVEHIPFENLLILVQESLRILKPGGVLIMETPNPGNIVVGSSSFYLDPTHRRPLPAQLLSFVAEYVGFERVSTLYLQEDPALVSTQKTMLINVFEGVSPDYAIIAQKETNKDGLILSGAPFDRSFGIQLNTLAERYDRQIEEKNLLLENELDKTNARIEDELDKINFKVHEMNKLYNDCIINLLRERDAVYSSRSWCITKPLRLLSLEFRQFINNGFIVYRKTRGVAKFSFKWILTFLIRFINKYPLLRANVFEILRKYPKLNAHLRRYATVRGIVTSKSPFGGWRNSHVTEVDLDDYSICFSPRTKRIYNELKASIDQHNKENR